MRQHEQLAASAPCTPVAVAFWRRGSELRQYYSDNHGHDVELWCHRGIFNAHWDLRVGGDQLADNYGVVPAELLPTIHRSVTIGGCFFDNGESFGPIIYEGPDHQYIKVGWTNWDPANEHEKYEFAYDYGTGLVTVVATTPGSPPVMTVVRPQESWEQLQDLLPQRGRPGANPPDGHVE